MVRVDAAGLASAVGAIAEQQHGVIAVRQLPAVDVPRRSLDHLVRRGHLRRIGNGVYAIVGTPDTWMHRLWAGYLALPHGAFVSHEAASFLNQLDRSRDGHVEFTVPRELRRTAPRLTIHTTQFIGRTDVITIGGLRATSATRTIIDLARARIAPVRLEAAIDSAVRIGSSSPTVLAARLEELRGRGRWGCRLLDRLLEDSGGHTLLERRFLQLVRRAGLPRPRTQVVHRVGGRTVARVDFLFDEYDIVVEVSGQKGHSSPSERARDAQRRNELQDLGRSVYEYTWEDVTSREPVVARTLRDRLVAAGWRP